MKDNKIIVVLEFLVNKNIQSIENLMRVIKDNRTQVLRASVLKENKITKGEK